MAEVIERHEDSIPDGNSDEEDGTLDPRIQDELDKLNHASVEINRLENEIDEARSQYRSTFSEASNEMEQLAKNKKRNIRKAREYYKLKEEARTAQGEALKAARQYQTATSIYNAAKETVALAEAKLIEKTSQSTASLSSAWQEMLNHATSRVMEAELEKTRSQEAHKKTSSRFADLEKRIQLQEKKFKRSIIKARPYFELKSSLDFRLQQQKQNVNDLQSAVKVNKAKYNHSLRKLETISEQIHESRRNKIWEMCPRMPCLGAETDSVGSSLSELQLDAISLVTGDSNSQDSDIEDENDPDTEQSQDLIFEEGGNHDSSPCHATAQNLRSSENATSPITECSNPVFNIGEGTLSLGSYKDTNVKETSVEENGDQMQPVSGTLDETDAKCDLGSCVVHGPSSSVTSNTIQPPNGAQTDNKEGKTGRNDSDVICTAVSTESRREFLGDAVSCSSSEELFSDTASSAVRGQLLHRSVLPGDSQRSLGNVVSTDDREQPLGGSVSSDDNGDSPGGTVSSNDSGISLSSGICSDKADNETNNNTENKECKSAVDNGDKGVIESQSCTEQTISPSLDYSVTG